MDKGYDVTTILPARAGEAAHISEVYAKRIVKYDYIINDIYSCDLDSPDPGSAETFAAIYGNAP